MTGGSLSASGLLRSRKPGKSATMRSFPVKGRAMDGRQGMDEQIYHMVLYLRLCL
jgi:hypothetical protein